MMWAYFCLPKKKRAMGNKYAVLFKVLMGSTEGSDGVINQWYRGQYIAFSFIAVKHGFISKEGKILV